MSDRRDPEQIGRLKVQVPSLLQQLAPGHPGQPLCREHQGDLLAATRKRLQAGKRLLRRSRAHHAVVPRVAVAQLSQDVPECLRILVDGDKGGTGQR